MEKNELHNVQGKGSHIEIVVRSFEIIVLRNQGMIAKSTTRNKGNGYDTDLLFRMNLLLILKSNLQINFFTSYLNFL
jgi:hypothetical protein